MLQPVAPISGLQWRLRSASGWTVTFLFLLSGCTTPSEETLSTARQKLNSGQVDAAKDATQRGIARGCEVDAWRTLSAEIELRKGHPQACLADLHKLAEFPDSDCATALSALGQLALEGGSVEIAEAAFRASLRADPGERSAIVNLGYLLGFEGRCWEAAEYHFQSVRSSQFTLHHLVLLGASDPVIDDPGLLQRCLLANPENPLPQLGVARTALRRDQFSQAAEILQRIAAVRPNCGESQGQLGRLYGVSDPDAFLRWNTQLPPTTEVHPEIWVARGLRARQLGQFTGTARCLWEAVKRDPNHRVAHFQLGQVLVALERADEADEFLLRAERLQQLTVLVDEIFQHPTDLIRLQRASELTETLGRFWEAWAWAHIALRADPRCRWAANRLQRLQTKLTATTPQVIGNAPLAERYDLSNLPLPDFSLPTQPPTLTHVSPPSIAAAITFEDQATVTGLDFVFHTRGPSELGPTRMYETTGGGVAVLDYDGDHYPDLYLTQAGSLTPEEQPTDWVDRCFRNNGGTAWQDITQTARLVDALYGQGATAGDFNNDGFVDLYVANLGRNRLFRNQGDGTFEDVTASAGLVDERWTTSCLLADLNGDGWPDLYDVNYLSREDAIRATCKAGEELRWCSPDAFAAEQDQLFLNLGDGRFRDMTAESGIVQPLGKGLGIVAADFNRSSRLSLFVANDAVPNFYFENRTDAVVKLPIFAENALPMGLAVDADGLPQACMGVAAGDLNDDRLLDLFVTNFYEQSNTLYLQRPGLLFEDATRKAGLREPSWRFLGFGTQCLDADLDGLMDLVVANGHVLDLSARGVPFRMRPQLFHNSGQGRFRELLGPALGNYFQREYLGRGLARVDWNRDGLPDFVVSHIRSPAAVVTNFSTQTGNSFAVRLVGVHGARDAIGAEVTVRAGDQTWLQQLTAGDGYQCRNEPLLIFGLGTTRQIDGWSVRWPAGDITEYGATTANVEVLALEGQQSPVILRLPQN